MATNDHAGRHTTHTGSLHPAVTTILVGSVVWFALAVWGFSLDGHSDYLLAIVCGFLLVALAVPFALWRQWRRTRRDGGELHYGSFRDWAAGGFDTWQDREKAGSAAAEIILPIAAAAVGMTLFGIVLHIVAAHVGG
ncbi:MAG TPA: hypothetical protein VFB45_11815 [Pseudolabrys sp.]|nr:hypothetical protein [Pseudolabrys sp.]